MKRYLSIIFAAMLLAACSTKVEQPVPGIGLGEIYVTAPAGERTVAVDLDGRWRVYSQDEWISLDVNGREGRGAFTFAYASNESDFAKVCQTRRGSIIIQSLNSMKADTLYVRQQGRPDGREYTSYDSSDYIEFVDDSFKKVNLIYANFDGVEDLASVTSWLGNQNVDVILAVCPEVMVEALSEVYAEHSVDNGSQIIISPSEVPVDEMLVSSPKALVARVGDISYVVSDFLKELPQGENRYNQFKAMLDSSYNAPMSSGKWLICGTFWYYSAMEAGYPATPSWYPADPDDSAFDADHYAWRNSLIDCIWMSQRDYSPTYTDEEGREWRPSYVYASAETWNSVIDVQILEVPIASMTHKIFRITLKY